MNHDFANGKNFVLTRNNDAEVAVNHDTEFKYSMYNGKKNSPYDNIYMSVLYMQ